MRSDVLVKSKMKKVGLGLCLYFLYWVAQSFFGSPITPVLYKFQIRIPISLVIFGICFLITLLNITKSIFSNNTSLVSYGVILGFVLNQFCYDSIDNYQMIYTSRSLDSICNSIGLFAEDQNRLPSSIRELKEAYPDTKTTNYYNLGKNGIRYKLENEKYWIFWETGRNVECDVSNCNMIFANMKYAAHSCYRSQNPLPYLE